MHADGDDDTLADIETHLASDRTFARRIAWTQATMRRHEPSWRSLGASGLLLIVSAALLVADVHLHQPWMLFPCVAVFAVAMRPVMNSINRRSPPEGNDREA